MMFSKEALSKRLSGIPLTNYCLFAAALFTFMGMAFGPFGSYLFEEVMVIPVILFLHVCFSRPIPAGAKKILGFSVLMLGWFLFLQIMRDLQFFQVYPFGTYVCSYLFAFPLASLLQDGDKKQALKLFAAVFVAVSVFHSVAALLLLLGLVPACFAEYHLFWDGSRLNSFWHPNMVACFLMFGIASCIAFLQETKKVWVKLALLVIIATSLITIGLTNCRTVVILTGGILGGAVFYAIIKGRWKLAPIGFVVAVAILVAVYLGCSTLYDANSDALYTSALDEYMEETGIEEAPENFALETTSAQGSLVDDISSMNSRTAIWQASFDAMNVSRSRYLFGVDYPGQHMSYFNDRFEPHTHNAWVETLMGMGIPGLILAMVITLVTLWNGMVILLKYSMDVWKRTIAMLCLCMLVASFLEPYLFLPPIDYYIYNFIFLLCAGYLIHWQEEDNRKMLGAVRKFLHI